VGKKFSYEEKTGCMHRFYQSCIDASWEDTFRPCVGPDKKQRPSHSFARYFLGIRTDDPVLFGVWLLGGFVFYPLKNILKLCTEFVLAVAYKTIKFLGSTLFHWMDGKTINPNVSRFLKFVIVQPLYLLLTLALFIPYYLIRSATAPRASMWASYRFGETYCWGQGFWFAFGSILCSVAMMVALFLVAAPVVSGIFVPLGLGSALSAIAHIPSLANLALLITAALPPLFGSGSTFVGAAALVVLSTCGFGFHMGIRGLWNMMSGEKRMPPSEKIVPPPYGVIGGGIKTLTKTEAEAKSNSNPSKTARSPYFPLKHPWTKLLG